MPTGIFFQEVQLPEQKSYGDGVIFPVVLSPNTNHNFTATEAKLCVFKEAIRDHKPWLESLLQKSGAILFRGFPVISPSDFNDVVEAFGFPESLYIGGRASRTKVIGGFTRQTNLGNGEVVPDEAMRDCLKILEEECVIIPWKKGDIMLVNNPAVLHSRLPLLKPPRRILASLCK
ncbi:hypothetical protein L1987_45260 [Smallanthus sonchifolius]|uniref:Uncharacterized protein n=1 Tax=Smallanthus sonchifolius TaxID=185202 RepID=A0ACB9GR62_9ASTR|nr:hypothetical protein L1987_45260 [Smallanthus sonchifolius]